MVSGNSEFPAAGTVYGFLQKDREIALQRFREEFFEMCSNDKRHFPPRHCGKGPVAEDDDSVFVKNNRTFVYVLDHDPIAVIDALQNEDLLVLFFGHDNGVDLSGMNGLQSVFCFRETVLQPVNFPEKLLPGAGLKVHNAALYKKLERGISFVFALRLTFVPRFSNRVRPGSSAFSSYRLRTFEVATGAS